MLTASKAAAARHSASERIQVYNTGVEPATWWHEFPDAVACKGLLWEARVVSINGVWVPAAKHVQPCAQHIQHIAFIHQQHPPVSVAAPPHCALQALLLGPGWVASLAARQGGTCVWWTARSSRVRLLLLSAECSVQGQKGTAALCFASKGCIHVGCGSAANRLSVICQLLLPCRLHTCKHSASTENCPGARACFHMCMGIVNPACVLLRSMFDCTRGSPAGQPSPRCTRKSTSGTWQSRVEAGRAA